MNKNKSNTGGVVLIIIAIVIIGAWYLNNRDKTITNCAVRTQDAYLETHYYSKGIQPTSDDLLQAYEAAEADCGI